MNIHEPLKANVHCISTLALFFRGTASQQTILPGICFHREKAWSPVPALPCPKPGDFTSQCLSFSAWGQGQ